jgi:hypothetical protein
MPLEGELTEGADFHARDNRIGSLFVVLKLKEVTDPNQLELKECG